MRQQVRYLTTPDGVRLAWAAAGKGPVLLKAANWLSHLEYEWDSPLWRHWMRFLGGRFRFIRYDERGNGMTDRDVGDLSAPRWLEDMESVADAAGIVEPAIVLGMSQGAGTAISYAARHPDRVSRLIIYGGYARGWARRDSPETERYYRAMLELMEQGWDSDNPSFRQLFTSRFIPDAGLEQVSWFNELCRRATSGPVAVQLMHARGQLDVTGDLEDVRVPTLVIHARDDGVVPATEGRVIASGIPDATFVELESRNHILLEHEPAWEEFRRRVLEFTGMDVADIGAFGALSRREREILAGITQGRSNAQIAERLHISEKTVRNRISRLFAKLGVRSRAQAIVLARDHGFQG